MALEVKLNSKLTVKHAEYLHTVIHLAKSKLLWI